MNDETRSYRRTNNGILRSPAYPFTGHDLFGYLRCRLGEDLGLKMTLDRLSRIMGRSISTTHYWLETCPHPHVIGFMSLLERLSPVQRQAFVEEHCRIFPTFTHPRLVNHPAVRSYLFKLLRKKTGLTVIGGGTDFSRTFLLTAFGHEYPATDSKQRSAVGIDLHRPNHYVPVEGLSYIDRTRGLDHVMTGISKVWAGLLTTKAPLVLFNRLWSCAPELRPDIINLGRSKHVVLADDEMPGPADLKRIHAEVHVLRISPRDDGFPQIRLACRRKK